MKAKGLLRAAFIRPLGWGVGKIRRRGGSPNAPQTLGHQRPVVIAHRGFSAIAPENTLPSFELAMAAGADLVELDYRQTADGQLLAIHDADLDRTTDARLRWGGKHIKVAETNSTKIRSLDAGRWFESKYSGTRVPLLGEALDVIQPGAIALLERKTGTVDLLVEVLRARRGAGRVMVQSFDWTFLQALHARMPELPLGALGPLTHLPRASQAPGLFGQLTRRWLRLLRKTGASVVVWNKQVTKPAVREAHEQGLKVWVYTVDRPELANRLLDIGVDGLITNNPALMWKIIALR